VEDEFFMAADPFGKVGDGLKANVVEAILFGSGEQFGDDHFEDARAPHSRSIGIGDEGQPVVGSVIVGPRLVFDVLLEEFHEVRVVLFGMDHCQNQQQQNHSHNHRYILINRIINHTIYSYFYCAAAKIVEGV
jgi:hypothetical protein